MSTAANNPAMEWMDLEELANALAAMPASELPRVLGQLRELEATAMARLYSSPRASEMIRQPEQLLDIAEAAKRLNVSEDYLYRHWKNLPFAHKYDWGLRFSARGIDEYIQDGGISVYTPRNKRLGGNQ
jgi:predicted DNA-binding transcriptional regulator AlpA